MNSRTAEYWGSFHGKKRPKLSWLEHPEVMGYIHKKHNSGAESFFSDMISQGRVYDRALILGCGTGTLEQQLASLGLFRSAVGIDISSKSLEIARTNAILSKIENISYQEFDLDNENICCLGSFDLIIINMVAHHVKNPKRLFRDCRSCLTQDGMLVLNEYVGPDRFQHSEETVSIINRLLESLDAKYKYNYLLDDGSLREVYIRTPIKHFMQHDPSEAIASSEIMSGVNLYFNPVSLKRYGGNINHMLLTGIIENFDDSVADKTILKLLMEFENILESYGIIESDFLFGVFTPHGFERSIGAGRFFRRLFSNFLKKGSLR